MNEDAVIKARLAEIAPPKGETARAVLLRLHAPQKRARRVLRPALCALLACLLLCGTVGALLLTGTVELRPGGRIALPDGAEMETLWETRWTPERLLPLSAEQRDWAEERRLIGDAPVRYEALETLAPMLEDAGLYRCPPLGAPVEEDGGGSCVSSCLFSGGIVFLDVHLRFRPENGPLVTLNLIAAFDDGTAELPELGTALGADESLPGAEGSYDSPVSGVTARYAFRKDESGNDEELFAWFPDGPALWKLTVYGRNADESLALLAELIDGLEK